MTAKKVGRLTVITAEPVLSPLSAPDKPVYFKQILRLLLSDGGETYGCAACDFTADAVGKVRQHNGTHKKGTPGVRVVTRAARAPAPPAPLSTIGAGSVAENMTILEVLNWIRENGKMVEAMEKMSDERNEWKRRALAAEKSVAQFRRALGKLAED